jgi:ribosomal protein S18 acetylase RimI-like enzyme
VELEWIYSQEEVDWGELSDLYRVAPLGVKAPKDLETAFSNSMFKCFLYEKEKVVGVGRVLADGVDCAYICDVAVHPGHQGLGLGRSIVEKLVELSRGHNKIILYAYPGKEGFYKKLGFKRMSTAMAIFEDQPKALKEGLVNDA